MKSTIFVVVIIIISESFLFCECRSCNFFHYDEIEIESDEIESDDVIEEFPYHDLKYVANINDKDANANGFTNNPILFNELLIKDQFLKHRRFQYVDVELLVYITEMLMISLIGGSNIISRM